MKAIKASKKLIISIIGFALSIVLCVGACLAWFAVNKKVDSSLSSVGVRSSDIVNFEVTVHYLDNVKDGYEKAASGNVKGTGGFVTGAENVDINDDGDLADTDKMRPYGGIGNTFATAVLFEMDYEIVTSDKHYRIFASCPTDSGLTVAPIGGSTENFESALSNAVGYYGVNVNGNVFSKADGDAESFVQSDNTKKNVIELVKNIAPSSANGENGNHFGKAYVIMDYMPANFIYLSSLMIRNGGTLTSGLTLSGDLTVNIESYGSDTPVGPDNPDPDEPDPPTTIQDSKTFGTASGAVAAGGKVFELVSDGASIASVNAAEDKAWTASSNYIQQGNKGDILKFQLAEGYTYTVKMSLSAGSANKTLTFSFNDVDGSAKQVSGNTATECEWILSGGTYTFHSSNDSSPRLYSISITATPI